MSGSHFTQIIGAGVVMPKSFARGDTHPVSYDGDTSCDRVPAERLRNAGHHASWCRKVDGRWVGFMDWDRYEQPHANGPFVPLVSEEVPIGRPATAELPVTGDMLELQALLLAEGGEDGHISIW